jgi:peptide/nickel transport system substrate-binding protein
MIKPTSAVFSLVAFFLFACSGDKSKTKAPVFRYNESNGISSLDPAYARDLESMWACNQLFDGLLRLDSQLRVQPCLAKAYSLSMDGTEYTFTLRTDVFFHPDSCFGPSGTRRFKASDAVFSFQRILDQGTASPGSWIFDALAQPVDSAIFAINDSTLLIRLQQPFPAFPGLLTTQYANIVPKEAIASYGEDFRAHPIGTGPFKFAFWMEDVALVFHRNANYWEFDEKGNKLPYLEAVKIDFVRDMNAEFMGLLKGDYDFMSGIHPSFKDELLSPFGELNPVYTDRIRFQKVPFIKTDYIGILVDPEIPLARNHPIFDSRIRRAINLGIDRRKMVRYLRNNSVFPAESGFVPPGLPGFKANQSSLSYKPDEARRLLAEAGYPGGKGLPPIEIATTSDYVDICEFIQHDLQILGIPVEINVLPGGTHRELVAKSELLAFRKSWLADYADAGNFLGLFYSENFCPQGPNYTHFSDPDFDSLFLAAQKEPSDSLRNLLFARMDSIVTAQAPVIPLYYDQVSHFVRREISGLETNPINMLDLRRVRKASGINH